MKTVREGRALQELTATNTYSATWHAVFGMTQREEVTAREVAFLSAVLPLPAHRSVLDVCCGGGRHLAGLSALGYDVTGLERDPVVARAAREAVPVSRVIEGDANRLSELVDGPFAGIVSMWASFGYGTPVEQTRLDGDRLTTTLDYGFGIEDVFSWQVFTPDELSHCPFGRVLAGACLRGLR